MDRPIQRILFGSPGTGKSYQIKNVIAPSLKIQVNSENYIPTVFHPEYTYGDFMGKLMPFTNDSGKVEYLFYRGHFLKALAQAYKNIILTFIELEENKERVGEDYKKEIGKTAIKSFTSEETREFDTRKDNIVRGKAKNVLLVIDEINRGNSAAIFGTVFQLLDRDTNNWSTYPISISDLEFKGLLQEMSFKYISYIKESKLVEEYYFGGEKITHDKFNDLQKMIFEDINETNLIEERKIKIPSNLSIVGTMNTSDNSIYFMDSAFKRRWDWEFIEIEDEVQKRLLTERRVNLFGQDKGEWCSFIDKLNLFIRSNYKLIRKIEDKQLGYRFINNPTISESDIKNKLMFFIWDSVFSNNKKPLVDLLGIAESELVTFGQFTKKEQVENFVNQILNFNV